MSVPILVQFVIIILINVIKSDYSFNLLEEEADKLQPFDIKYKTDNLNKNYLIIIKLRENDNKQINREDFKQIARLNYDVETKKKQLKEDIILSQHKARMKEVTDFMKDHMMTTKYLYEEVKRIKRDRQIKDALREMVEYLERPENKDEKAAVLKFFVKNKKIHTKKKKNVWDQKTNDLVINVIKDPFNDGTIN